MRQSEQFYRENGYVSRVVNNIFESKGMSYLELGLHRGVNHAEIHCKHKVSVDTNPETNPTHCMTTDQFFEQKCNCTTRYDIIFVDACHEYKQVVKDFNNAILHAYHAVILHDMWPPSKELTTPDKCGDAYKLLYHLVKNTASLPLTLNTDCGLTVIPMPTLTATPPSSLDDLTYEDFAKGLQHYNRYPVNEFLEVTRRFI